MNGLQGVIESLTSSTTYLDDYLIIGNPQSKQCESDLQSFQSILQWLKVQVAREKLEGPSTRLTFLGIELDTVSEECVRGDTFPRKFCPTGQDILSILGQIVRVCF